jgi:hypothetical protein
VVNIAGGNAGRHSRNGRRDTVAPMTSRTSDSLDGKHPPFYDRTIPCFCRNLSSKLDPLPIDRQWNWNEMGIEYEGSPLAIQKVAVVTGDQAAQGP